MRLTLLVVAALLPALSLFIVSAALERRHRVEHTRGDAMQLVREVSARERQIFETARGVLEVVSLVPGVRDGSGERCHDFLASLIDEHSVYFNIGIIDMDGSVVCSALAPQPVDVSDRAYFRRAVETGRFSVGNYQVGRLTQRESVNVALPLYGDDGTIESVAFAALDLSWLRRMAMLSTVPGGTVLTLVDSNGTILARSVDASRWIGRKLPDENRLWQALGESGATEMTDIDGTRRLIAYAPLLPGVAGRIHLIAGIPVETAFADAQGAFIVELLVILVVGLLVILAAWFGGHAFIARRVERLAQTASRLGAGDLQARAMDTMDYGQDEIGELARVLDSMAESINEREGELQRSHSDIASAIEATIEGWARALERRDSDTEGHTRRVAELAVRLSRAMGVSEGDIVHIRRGALLHDIGKMGIPDSILLKPGPLTDEEWVVMRRHPSYAYEWLSHIPFLRPALEIPYCHHERWDGSGYPRGLVGLQIPLAARMFAIIDVYDGVTSDRPYRDAWSEERALHYIREGSGTLFDSRAVDAFLALKTKVRPDAEVVYQSRGARARAEDPELVDTRG
jgi:HAMP domain-containing protein